MRGLYFLNDDAMISIYTDGAAKGNPGPGGYGVVMISGPHRKELSEGFRLTTNNRMELLSVIIALETLKTPGSAVTVYSDSKYVVDSVEKGWVFNWEKKYFNGKKNADLWQRFLRIYPKHKVRFHWVKGHASNAENNRCDELAVAASHGTQMRIDSGYENEVARLKSEK
jgi:ribonuclease HI